MATQQTEGFKSYSEKSKARRALREVFNIADIEVELYLDRQDNKNGFTLRDGKPVYSNASANATAQANAKFEEDAAAAYAESMNGAPVQTTTLKIASKDGADLGTLMINDDSVALAKGTVESMGGTATEVESELESTAPSASAFGGFAMSQLCAPSNKQTDAPSTSAQRVEGLKIDKDRNAANGVKERSKGGLCRLVWDTLDGMVANSKGTVPSVADIKKHATEQGWNVNNASIEYYQWRKFHGISGRGAKTL